MNITKDKVVSLSYQLRINGEDGEIVEEVTDQKPMAFIYGAGIMLPKFEENLEKLSQGDDFKFHLKSEDAYGDVKQEAIVDLPKHIFEVEGKIDEGLLKVDNVIPMQDQEGNRLHGVVREVKPETVKMDFNHPLAGEDLFFTGKVENIRDASKEELEHGHVHDGSQHE